jgi:hypothetical protein
VLSLLDINKSEVSVMHQSGCLERLTRLFMGELCGSQFTQLLVDQRQKLTGGGGVALFDLCEDVRDIGLAADYTAPRMQGLVEASSKNRRAHGEEMPMIE